VSWADLAGLPVTAGFAIFGEPVLYYPPTPAPVEGEDPPVPPDPLTLVGIFQERPTSLTAIDLQISSVEPVLDLRAADIVGGPQTRIKVTVRNRNFTISSIEGPDEAGVARCQLRVA
jgi:hypothetical protein